MAKGNLFLGTAANSVGDVVMYRREGAQVSRVRVRNVANPRTNAQSTQRAFFAPVAKFYSPLSTILERSFEGLNKSKSYSKFLKTNVSLARANDWLLPKGTGFFPLPYQLSQGTLPVFPATFPSNDFQLMFNVRSSVDAPATIGNLSEDLIDAGYSSGDVVSIICVKKSSTDNSYYPVAFQFIIDSTSNILFTDFVHNGIYIGYDSDGGYFVGDGGDNLYAGAVIVARYENDKWRRSSQNLLVNSTLMNSIGEDSFKAAAIASYGNSATGDNPLVYLDGDELADNA